MNLMGKNENLCGAYLSQMHRINCRSKPRKKDIYALNSPQKKGKMALRTILPHKNSPLLGRTMKSYFF